jgi:hypothetical protein
VKLNEELVLPTAGIYPNPGDPGAVLPLVYGDFQSEDAATGAEIGGATPAVLIDRINGIWLVNNARSHPDKPRLYMNGRLQADDQFAYNPAAVLGDAQGNVHTIAVITLNPAIVGLVLENDFSVDMRGTVDEQDVLITNPITAIQHAFTSVGNWVDTDFDPVSCHKARDLATALGLPVGWAFTDTRSYKQHLTDILYHYHGNHTLNLLGQLVITLDQDQFVPSDQIAAFLDVQRDVAGEDPDDAVEWDLDKRNVANALVLTYRYSWASNKYGQVVERTAASSINLYGVLKRDIRLPGIRNEHHLNQWAALYLNRYSLLPGVVRFSLRTLAHLGLQPGTYCTLNWAAGPAAHGEGWTGRILKVLNFSLDFGRDEIGLECFDTGLTYLLPTYLVMRDQQENIWYLRATEGQTFQLLDYIPGEVSLLPTPVYWIQRQSPDNTTMYVYPTPDATLLVSNVQPLVGTGTSVFLPFIDRFSRTWGLEVGNLRTIKRTDLLNFT